MLAWIVLAFLVFAGLFLVFRGDISFLSDLGTTEIILLAAGVVLALVYVAVLLSDERVRPWQAIRHLGIWLLIGFGLVALYSYRDELSDVVYRVAGELVPAGQTMVVETGHEGEKAVRVRRRLDGHFAARGTINGQSMSLLVDTGATTVVLKPADAERAGIDVDSLQFIVPVQTANGTAYAAPVRLRSITIGPIVVPDVEALVAKPGSVKENLLGMSFLRRLRSYEFSSDFLTLRG